MGGGVSAKRARAGGASGIGPSFSPAGQRGARGLQPGGALRPVRQAGDLRRRVLGGRGLLGERIDPAGELRVGRLLRVGEGGDLLREAAIIRLLPAELVDPRRERRDLGLQAGVGLGRGGRRRRRGAGLRASSAAMRASSGPRSGADGAAGAGRCSSAATREARSCTCWASAWVWLCSAANAAACCCGGAAPSRFGCRHIQTSATTMTMNPAA